MRARSGVLVVVHCGITGLIGTVAQIRALMSVHGLVPIDRKEARYLAGLRGDPTATAHVMCVRNGAEGQMADVK